MSAVRRIPDDDDDDDLANALLALVDAGPQPQSTAVQGSSASTSTASASSSSSSSSSSFSATGTSANAASGMTTVSDGAASMAQTNKDAARQRQRNSRIGFSDDETPAPSANSGSRKRKTTTDSSSRSSAQRLKRPVYNNVDGDDDDDSDSFGSDDNYDGLVESGSDRENLESLPELERERILNERAEKRDLMREKKALEKKLRQAGIPLYEDATASAVAMETPKLSKRQQLELLKDKRAEKLRKSEQRNARDNADASNESAEQSVNLGNSASSTSGYGNSPTASRKNSQDLYEISYSDMLKLQLTRSDISRLCFAEFFPTVAIGSFVRVNLGPEAHAHTDNYRIAEIIELRKRDDMYIVNGQRVNLNFLLKHGNSERIFLADIFSNSPFTEAEYNRWKMQMIQDNARFPGRYEAQTKAAELLDSQNYIFTDKEICDMVSKKKMAATQTRNFAAEKVNLLRKQAIASSSGNQQNLEEINRQLQKLREDSEAARAKQFPNASGRNKSRTQMSTSNINTPVRSDSQKQEGQSGEQITTPSNLHVGSNARGHDPAKKYIQLPAGKQLVSKRPLSPSRTAHQYHHTPALPGPERYLVPSFDTPTATLSTLNSEVQDAGQTSSGPKSYEELFSAATTNFDIDIDI